jgi:hypothetical protein
VLGSLGAAAATLLPGQTSLAGGYADREQVCEQFCRRCGLSGVEYLVCVEACEHNINFNEINFNGIFFNGVSFNGINFNQISLNCL